MKLTDSRPIVAALQGKGPQNVVVSSVALLALVERIEKEVEIKRKDLGHYAGHRARMGRVLPDKLKPTALRMMSKPQEPEQ